MIFQISEPSTVLSPPRRKKRELSVSSPGNAKRFDFDHPGEVLPPNPPSAAGNVRSDDVSSSNRFVWDDRLGMGLGGGKRGDVQGTC